VCLLGALHCGEPDTMEAMKPIWPLADAMVSSQLQVQRPPDPSINNAFINDTIKSPLADPRMQRLEHLWH
jgi:hypothetical protein